MRTKPSPYSRSRGSIVVINQAALFPHPEIRATPARVPAGEHARRFLVDHHGHHAPPGGRGPPRAAPVAPPRQGFVRPVACSTGMPCASVKARTAATNRSVSALNTTGDRSRLALHLAQERDHCARHLQGGDVGVQDQPINRAVRERDGGPASFGQRGHGGLPGSVGRILPPPDAPGSRHHQGFPLAASSVVRSDRGRRPRSLFLTTSSRPRDASTVDCGASSPAGDTVPRLRGVRA